MSELKPCSYCGGKPAFSEERYAKLYGFNHTCKGKNPQVHVKCNGYSSLEEAIDAWNELMSGTVWDRSDTDGKAD